jgi:hypothetical protein
VGLELGGQPFGPIAFRGRYTSHVRRPFQTKRTGKSTSQFNHASTA